MEELIFSVISLIILSPIIYFLPLGLSNKGKGLLILFCFIFANLGLFSLSYLPLWQTGLVLFLLIILTVYIMAGRLSVEKTNLPISVEKSVDIQINEDEELIEEAQFEKINDQGRLSLEKEIPLSIKKDQIEIEELSFDSNEKVAPEEALDDSFVLEEIEEEIVIDDTPIKVEMEELDENTSFLKDREEMLEGIPPKENDPSLIDQHGSYELANPGYMSEIEQLLQEEDHNLENWEETEIEGLSFDKNYSNHIDESPEMYGLDQMKLSVREVAASYQEEKGEKGSEGGQDL